MATRIAIGCDHGGFKLKQAIIKELKASRYSVRDVGTGSEQPCDYPLIGFECASRISKKEDNKGILICRTGIGMAVIANKLPGVRAGVCNRPSEAVSARQHNDINLLVLAADRISNKDALRTVKVWLATRPLKGRHGRRVALIKEYENKVFKKNLRS